MPARTIPLTDRAEARAQRHASTFTASQLPAPDPAVLRLHSEGYNAHQIASLARMPMIDVRLMLAAAGRQSVTSTRGVGL
jgi:hypothetical protein